MALLFSPFIYSFPKFPNKLISITVPHKLPLIISGKLLSGLVVLHVANRTKLMHSAKREFGHIQVK